MICMYCGGRVEWRGPLVNPTHTQCTLCGQWNCEHKSFAPEDAFELFPPPDEFLALVDIEELRIPRD